MTRTALYYPAMSTFRRANFHIRPNIPLLEEIATLLEGKHPVGKIPGEFDFPSFYDPNVEEPRNLCKTKACAAGWAVLMLPQFKGKKIIKIGDPHFFDLDKFGDIVGLPTGESYHDSNAPLFHIFVSSGSPFAGGAEQTRHARNQGKSSYYTPLTPKDIATRIRNFIKQYRELERQEELEKITSLEENIESYDEEIEYFKGKIKEYEAKIRQIKETKKRIQKELAQLKSARTA